jgi:hypothetical protein
MAARELRWATCVITYQNSLIGIGAKDESSPLTKVVYVHRTPTISFVATWNKRNEYDDRLTHPDLLRLLRRTRCELCSDTSGLQTERSNQQDIERLTLHGLNSSLTINSL